MIGFLVFCLAMIFILYVTVGASLSDFKRQQTELQSDENYENVHKLVSAGSAEKTCREAVVRIKGGFFEHNGEKINLDGYTLMVVDGNSMDRFGVKDGEIVFVDDEDRSLSRKRNTFFVLRIDNWDATNKIEYKLRRAIDFYDCIYESKDAFDIWVKNHPELNKDKLYEKYEKEYAKIEECKRFRCRLLVSETTRDGKPYYSFHPEKCIYGKVRYKVPKETVKIIEKR
ncbi:MAG: hypothetical protein LBS43_11655 [Prevotellaceae bacterium]|jgi:hypothetical protein|nr:hypothetical protein [Prevotellaceae bacterium]